MQAMKAIMVLVLNISGNFLEMDFWEVVLLQMCSNVQLVLQLQKLKHNFNMSLERVITPIVFHVLTRSGELPKILISSNTWALGTLNELQIVLNHVICSLLAKELTEKHVR